MKAGGRESGAVGQHPSTAMPRMQTPDRGCLCIGWEALCEEAPRGSVSSGGPSGVISPRLVQDMSRRRPGPPLLPSLAHPPSPY